MSIFSHKQPVDMDQLDQDVTAHLHRLNAETNANAQPQQRHYSPLQTIGYEITRLTWTEAEEMGASIQAKIKDKTITQSELTAAIQEWASEWENFHNVQA